MNNPTKHSRNTVLRLVTLLILAASWLSAQTPTPETLMRKLADTLKNYDTVQFSSTLRMEMGSHEINGDFQFATAKGNKWNVKGGLMGVEIAMVSDGVTAWMYNTANNQYQRISQPAGGLDFLKSMGLNMPTLPENVQVKHLGEETIVIDGLEEKCRVVEVRMGELALPSPGTASQTAASDLVMTLTYDQKLGLTRKISVTMKIKMGDQPAMDVRQTLTYKNYRFNEPLDDSMFLFTPPAGAKEVASNLPAPNRD